MENQFSNLSLSLYNERDHKVNTLHELIKQLDLRKDRDGVDTIALFAYSYYCPNDLLELLNDPEIEKIYKESFSRSIKETIDRYDVILPKFQKNLLDLIARKEIILDYDTNEFINDSFEYEEERADARKLLYNEQEIFNSFDVNKQRKLATLHEMFNEWWNESMGDDESINSDDEKDEDEMDCTEEIVEFNLRRLKRYITQNEYEVIKNYPDEIDARLSYIEYIDEELGAKLKFIPSAIELLNLYSEFDTPIHNIILNERNSILDYYTENVLTVNEYESSILRVNYIMSLIHEIAGLIEDDEFIDKYNEIAREIFE